MLLYPGVWRNIIFGIVCNTMFGIVRQGVLNIVSRFFLGMFCQRMFGIMLECLFEYVLSAFLVFSPYDIALDNLSLVELNIKQIRLSAVSIGSHP